MGEERNYWKPFISEENKEKKLKIEYLEIQDTFETEEKLERKKQEHNERFIKDRRIRDTRTLFEQQEDYYEPKRVSSFWNDNSYWISE